jgi:hypothetical protein
MRRIMCIHTRRGIDMTGVINRMVELLSEHRESNPDLGLPTNISTNMSLHVIRCGDRELRFVRVTGMYYVLRRCEVRCAADSTYLA